ncbi:MAG: phosphate uptake regulator PhoU [Myxococcales bacterium]|nr:phosphate uptake regulator PhoU [Myxococcales bacterium]
MWMELIDIFRGGDELQAAGDDLFEMLAIVRNMASKVRPHVFDHSISMDDRARVYELDIQVNKLQRRVRKRVVAHLSLNPTRVPYCLLLMTLVKDAERVGDYIKNVTEVAELGGGPVPEGELREELEQLIDIASELLTEVEGIIRAQDRERATELLQRGRAAGKRCDRLLVSLSHSTYSAGEVTSMVLLTRFYKRLGAHLVNILSSVVMPLHKVDFYDEAELEP